MAISETSFEVRMMRGSQNSYFHEIYGWSGKKKHYKVKALDRDRPMTMQCGNSQIIKHFVADFVYCCSRSFCANFAKCKCKM